MPKLLERELEKAATGMRWLSFKSSAGFDKRKQEEKRWNSRRKWSSVGDGCSKACTTMFFLDSEERHEQASHCADAYDDPLVKPCESQKLRTGSEHIVLSGMPRMGVMEELNARTVCEFLLEMKRFNYKLDA